MRKKITISLMLLLLSAKEFPGIAFYQHICWGRVIHDFQFSQGDWPLDIFVGVEINDKKI